MLTCSPRPGNKGLEATLTPEPLKNAYLGARALVGWDYAPPAIKPAH